MRNLKNFWLFVWQGSVMALCAQTEVITRIVDSIHLCYLILDVSLKYENSM